MEKQSTTCPATLNPYEPLSRAEIAEIDDSDRAACEKMSSPGRVRSVGRERLWLEEKSFWTLQARIQSKSKELVLYLAPKGVAEEDDFYRGSTGRNQRRICGTKMGVACGERSSYSTLTAADPAVREMTRFPPVSLLRMVSRMCVCMYEYVRRLQGPVLWVTKRRWAMVRYQLEDFTRLVLFIARF
jgi:hypothetical protein